MRLYRINKLFPNNDDSIEVIGSKKKPLCHLEHIIAACSHCFTILWILLMISCSSVDAIPSSELNVLQALYDATQGDDWAWHSPTGHWNFTGDPDPCYDN